VFRDLFSSAMWCCISELFPDVSRGCNKSASHSRLSSFYCHVLWVCYFICYSVDDSVNQSQWWLWVQNVIGWLVCWASWLFFGCEVTLYQPIAPPGKQFGTPCRNKTVNVQVKDLFYDFFFFYDFVKRFVLTFVTKYRINYPSTAMYLQVSQVVANFPTKIILCVSTLCYVGFLHA